MTCSKLVEVLQTLSRDGPAPAATRFASWMLHFEGFGSDNTLRILATPVRGH
jgi:hypothetical protein